MTESQQILACISSLFPAWKQKDFTENLEISQSYVSGVKAGKKNFSRHVMSTITLKILDRVAEIVGETASYNDIRAIVAYYQQLHQDMQPEEADRNFEIAAQIYKTGYWIV